MGGGICNKLKKSRSKLSEWTRMDRISGIWNTFNTVPVVSPANDNHINDFEGPCGYRTIVCKRCAKTSKRCVFYEQSKLNWNRCWSTMFSWHIGFGQYRPMASSLIVRG